MGRRLIVLRGVGGKEVGLGHVTRSMALASEIAGLGVECVLSVNDDAAVGALTADADVAVHVGSNVAELAALVGSAAVVLDLAVDVAVVASEVRAAQACSIVALDCFDADADVDLVVNLVDHTPIDARPRRRGRVIEGLDHAILRQQFDGVVAPPVRPAIARALIAFGGSDTGDHTAAAVHAVCGALPDATIEVVVGAAARDPFDSGERRVHVHRAVHDMAALLTSVDIAVIGGAGTMLELAAVGVPSIFIARNESEAGFAVVVGRAGAASVVSEVDGIAAALTAMSSASARASMVSAARRLVDGCGRRRVAELVIATALP